MIHLCIYVWVYCVYSICIIEIYGVTENVDLNRMLENLTFHMSNVCVHTNLKTKYKDLYRITRMDGSSTTLQLEWNGMNEC